MTPVPYGSSMLHIPQTIYCLLALQKNKTKQNKKTKAIHIFFIEISENQKGQKQKKDKTETATAQETITRKAEKWNQNRFLRFRQGKTS